MHLSHEIIALHSRLLTDQKEFTENDCITCCLIKKKDNGHVQTTSTGFGLQTRSNFVKHLFYLNGNLPLYLVMGAFYDDKYIYALFIFHNIHHNYISSMSYYTHIHFTYLEMDYYPFMSLFLMHLPSNHYLTI